MDEKLKISSERKTFQPLRGDENPQFLEDGKWIYWKMKEKYQKKTHKDLDNILNGICASLILLMEDSVDKDNKKIFLQLVYQILLKNI